MRLMRNVCLVSCYDVYQRSCDDAYQMSCDDGRRSVSLQIDWRIDHLIGSCDGGYRMNAYAQIVQLSGSDVLNGDVHVFPSLLIVTGVFLCPLIEIPLMTCLLKTPLICCCEILWIYRVVLYCFLAILCLF